MEPQEVERLCQKPYWNFMQKIKHNLAMPITWLLMKTPVLPNHVTIVWMGLSIYSILLMASGKYYVMLLGVVLYHLFTLLDAVDGQLARCKYKFSVLGIYLDSIGHNINTILIFLSLGFGLYVMYDHHLYLILGMATAITYLFSKIIVLNIPQRSSNVSIKVENKLNRFVNSIHAKNNQGVISVIVTFVKLESWFNVLFLSILFNKAWFVLVFYFIIYTLDAIRRGFKMLWGLEDIDNDTR